MLICTPVACKRLSITNRNTIAATSGSISRQVLAILLGEKIATAATVCPAARNIRPVCVLKAVAVTWPVRVIRCPVYVNLGGIGRALVPVVVDLHLRGGGD